MNLDGTGVTKTTAEAKTEKKYGPTSPEYALTTDINLHAVQPFYYHLKGIDEVYFPQNDKILVRKEDKKIWLINLERKERRLLSEEGNFYPSPDKSKIVFTSRNQWYLLDLSTPEGKIEKWIDCPPGVKVSFVSFLPGGKDLLVGFSSPKEKYVVDKYTITPIEKYVIIGVDGIEKIDVTSEIKGCLNNPFAFVFSSDGKMMCYETWERLYPYTYYAVSVYRA